MKINMFNKFASKSFKANKSLFKHKNFKFNSNHVRSMATLKELKGRIASINQISKITTSMKQVAAAKLKQQQSYTESARPFFEGISESVVFKPENEYEIVEPGKPRLIEGSVTPEKGSDTLWLVCTSDKGLCGSLNTTLLRPVKSFVDKSTKLVSLGGKGVSQLVDKKFNLWFAVKDTAKDPFTFQEAAIVADRVNQSGRKKIFLMFNKFVNVLISKPTITYIPSREEIKEKDLKDYELEEPAELTRVHMADFFLACAIFNSVVENACSEIGARMTSMETASSNAVDIVENLTIEYNSRRQAAINKELSELVGGSGL